MTNSRDWKVGNKKTTWCFAFSRHKPLWRSSILNTGNQTLIIFCWVFTSLSFVWPRAIPSNYIYIILRNSFSSVSCVGKTTIIYMQYQNMNYMSSLVFVSQLRIYCTFFNGFIVRKMRELALQFHILVVRRKFQRHDGWMSSWSRSYEILCCNLAFRNSRPGAILPWVKS